MRFTLPIVKYIWTVVIMHERPIAEPTVPSAVAY